MGQYALILVAAGILTAGLVLGGIRTDTSRADVELNQYHAYMSARDLAMTGLQLTVGRLARDKGPWSSGANYAYGETEYSSGRFRTVVRPFGATGDTVDVEAIGMQPYMTRTGFGRDTLVIIEARYSREYADGGVPPAFRNAITTELGLGLSGSIWIHAPGPGPDCTGPVTMQNASVHTNSDFNASGALSGAGKCGDPYTGVEGYVTFSGTGSWNKNIKVQPRVDYGPDWIQQGDRIEIPLIQIDSATASVVCTASCVLDGAVLAAQNITTFSQWAASLTPPRSTGTGDAPFIYYAEGPLTIKDLNLSGYGIIYAGGEGSTITLQGNVNWDESTKSPSLGTLDADGSPTVMIATLDGIALAGNNKIVASLYGWDRIGFNGEVRIEGGIVTRNLNHNKGNVEIVYRGPSEEITDPGFEFFIPIGPVLIAYSEGWWTPR